MLSREGLGWLFERSSTVWHRSRFEQSRRVQIVPPAEPKRVQTTLVKGGPELNPMLLRQMAKALLGHLVLAPSRLVMDTSD